MSGLVGYGNDPVKIVLGVDAPGPKEWTFDPLGNIVLPQGGNILDYNGISVLSPLNTGNIDFNLNTITNAFQDTDINIETINSISGPQTWNFDSFGRLTLPSQGIIIQNFSITKTTSVDITDPTIPQIVWTSDSTFTSSAKLLIQLEQDPGDSTADEVHSCEAIISAKGAGGLGLDIPVMSVFGVTYTSLSSLATFSIQRNAVTRIIEVIATLNNTTDPAFLRIHSVEMLSRG